MPYGGCRPGKSGRSPPHSGDSAYPVQLSNCIFPPEYPDNIVQIPFGVYACTVVLNNDKKQYNAIMNWGIKPTLNSQSGPIAEVHIINYNGDLYGQKLEVNILKMIRQEQKFKS